MENMGTIGLFTAGLAILALYRLLVAFRELRGELLAQRQRLVSVLDRVDAVEVTLHRLSSGMPDLNGLLQRIEQAEKRAVNPRYEEAARLVRVGEGDAELTTRCGLSRGEARLVNAIWRSRNSSHEVAEVDDQMM